MKCQSKIFWEWFVEFELFTACALWLTRNQKSKVSWERSQMLPPVWRKCIAGWLWLKVFCALSGGVIGLAPRLSSNSWNRGRRGAGSEVEIETRKGVKRENGQRVHLTSHYLPPLPYSPQKPHPLALREQEMTPGTMATPTVNIITTATAQAWASRVQHWRPTAEVDKHTHTDTHTYAYTKEEQ